MTPSACGYLSDVSICIPVGRSPHFVREILRELSAQGFPGPVVLAWYFAELGCELESLRQNFRDRGLDVRTIRGKGHYAPNLRNAAVRKVDTTWCLCLDDDVVLAENYIEVLTTILQRHQTPIVLQGAPFACANPRSWLARCEARLYQARLDVYREGANIRVCDARNLLIPTAIVSDIGFDDELRLGSEGHVLAQRLIAQGSPILYAADLSVSHYHRDSFVALWRQKFTHGRGRVYTDRCSPDTVFRKAFTVLGELFWRHGLGPLRYWWAGRIPFDLVPYALLTATMFCSGMMWELLRTSLGMTRAHIGLADSQIAGSKEA